MRTPRGHIRRHGNRYEIAVPVGRDPITKRYRYVYDSASTEAEAEHRRAAPISSSRSRRVPIGGYRTSRMRRQRLGLRVGACPSWCEAGSAGRAYQGRTAAPATISSTSDQAVRRRCARCPASTRRPARSREGARNPRRAQASRGSPGCRPGCAAASPGRGDRPTRRAPVRSACPPGIVAPGSRPASQRFMCSPDRKRFIVLQVKTMSSHQRVAGSRQWNSRLWSSGRSPRIAIRSS